MNLHIVKGNLGSDPVIRSFDWGKTASFSVATSETYTNKKGEKVTDTDWHSVVFRGPVCDTIEKHLHKGDQVLITGKSKTRKYTDKNEQDHWATELIADSFEFCGGQKKEGKPNNLEGQFQKGGKVTVSSMSDADQLPGANDLTDLPF